MARRTLKILQQKILYLANFFDVIFYFCNITYAQYRKPNNHLVYINKKSNYHPKNFFERVNKINELKTTKETSRKTTETQNNMINVKQLSEEHF